MWGGFEVHAKPVGLKHGRLESPLLESLQRERRLHLDLIANLLVDGKGRLGPIQYFQRLVRCLLKKSRQQLLLPRLGLLRSVDKDIQVYVFGCCPEKYRGRLVQKRQGLLAKYPNVRFRFLLMNSRLKP